MQSASAALDAAPEHACLLSATRPPPASPASPSRVVLIYAALCLPRSTRERAREPTLHRASAPYTHGAHASRTIPARSLARAPAPRARGMSLAADHEHVRRARHVHRDPAARCSAVPLPSSDHPSPPTSSQEANLTNLPGSSNQQLGRLRRKPFRGMGRPVRGRQDDRAGRGWLDAGRRRVFRWHQQLRLVPRAPGHRADARV